MSLALNLEDFFSNITADFCGKIKIAPEDSKWYQNYNLSKKLKS